MKMATRENIDGQNKSEPHHNVAVDGAGQHRCDTQWASARPEPIGGQECSDTQSRSAANGDGRAKHGVNPKERLPAVADPIESETGDGQRCDGAHSAAAITNGGGHRSTETHGNGAPADPTSSGHMVCVTQKDRAAAGDETGQCPIDSQASYAGLIATLTENGGQIVAETQDALATVNGHEAGQNCRDTQSVPAGLMATLTESQNIDGQMAVEGAGHEACDAQLTHARAQSRNSGHITHDFHRSRAAVQATQKGGQKYRDAQPGAAAPAWPVPTNPAMEG